MEFHFQNAQYMVYRMFKCMYFVKAEKKSLLSVDKSVEHLIKALF